MTNDLWSHVLSGPMSGISDFNFPAFDAAAQRLRAQGYYVFNPAESSREIGDGLEYNVYLRYCICKICLIDMAWGGRNDGNRSVLVQLPGWERSKGALAEYHLAVALGWKIEEYESC